MSRLVSLDEPDALDIGLVGAKAAHLARARQRGYDVLPGLVVTTDEARSVLDAGRGTLAARNAGAARAAVTSAALPPGLADALVRAGELGGTLVVRSSTPLDDDAGWSGAFASLGDVTPDAVEAAVRSCWASLFTPDVLDRFEASGIAHDTARIAVLIQPQVEPAVGGWTRIVDGRVEVAAIEGSPAALLAGWERGSRYVVASDGRSSEVAESGPVHEDPAGPLDPSALARVVDLALLAHDELGAGRLEWALADDRLIVLQLDPAGDDEAAAVPGPSIPDALRLAPFRRFVRVLLGRSGRLADALLVPWAAAAPETWRVEDVQGDPAAVFEAARTTADRLAETVARSVGLTTAELIEAIDSADETVAGRLAMVSVDPGSVGRVVGAIERVGRHLTADGALRTPDAIWSQTVDWVEHALATSSPRPAARRVGDRWGHLVYGVTVLDGRATEGTGASDGWAAGRACFVSTAADVRTFRSGDVLVVNRPIPKLAPLLWEASALVCRTGNPAAHLCEVARSLHVPAVVSSNVPGDDREWAAAVDGVSGSVHWWAPTDAPGPSSPAATRRLELEGSLR